eukprot:364743-Chlamydomonas_euryale.AAC.38
MATWHASAAANLKPDAVGVLHFDNPLGCKFSTSGSAEGAGGGATSCCAGLAYHPPHNMGRRMRARAFRGCAT